MDLTRVTSNIPDSRRRTPCKFVLAWCYFNEFSTWLVPVSGDHHKAYCILCERSFSIAHSGLHDVKAHWTGKRHCQLQNSVVQNGDIYEKFEIKALSVVFNEKVTSFLWGFICFCLFHLHIFSNIGFIYM